MSNIHLNPAAITSTSDNTCIYVSKNIGGIPKVDDEQILDFTTPNKEQNSTLKLLDDDLKIAADVLGKMLSKENSGDGITVKLKLGSEIITGAFNDSQPIVFESKLKNEEGKNAKNSEEDDLTIPPGESFASLILSNLTLKNSNGETITLAEAHGKDPEAYGPYANAAIASVLLENGIIDEILPDGDYLGLKNTLKESIVFDMPGRILFIEPAISEKFTCNDNDEAMTEPPMD